LIRNPRVACLPVAISCATRAFVSEAPAATAAVAAASGAGDAFPNVHHHHHRRLQWATNAGSKDGGTIAQ